MNAIELAAEWCAGYTTDAHGMAITGNKMATELRRLHTENEALRKDAERYVWIRDQHQYSDRGWEIVQEVNSEEWDEAIDTAMEQTK